jgi:hypothetical protein
MSKSNSTYTKKSNTVEKTVDKEIKPKIVKTPEAEKIIEIENKSSDINIQDIIAKAVAEALEKQAKEIAQTQTTTKPKKNKYVPENARIRLESNDNGKIIISDQRGQNFFLELNGYKDNVTMSFKDLKNFHGKHYTMFNSGILTIVDIATDADIEVEDVIKDLGLTKIYYDPKKINPNEIEEVFTSDCSITDFENKVRNSVEIAESIIAVAHILYKRGIFTDNSKMNFLRQHFRNSVLFTR